MSFMPAWLRAAYRRFYLNQKLDQIELNKQYVQELILERQEELRKLHADEALVRHELGCL